MADTSVGDVIAQFRTVLGLIDETAVIAARAREEAEQAQTTFAEASQGTAHQLMRKAVVDTRTAAEKAGKTARLLAEAAEHFTTYVNIISPGTVSPRSSAPEAMPDGDRVTSEAMNRPRRATSFLDRTARRADDVQDTATQVTKAVEEGTKVALRQIKGDGAPGRGPTSTTSTSPSQPAPVQHPPAHEVVSTLVITTLGAALVGRAAIDYIKKRLSKRKQNEDQD